MLQQAISLFFPIFSLIVSLITVSTANSNIYIDCSSISFASMTPYDSNVNSLFSSLVDSASLSNFNKFEISPPGNSQWDDVYGLFQCQGDLNSAECKDCVAASVNQLKTTCPVSTGGTIQLEGCFVRYDNTSFFGVEDKKEASRKCGPSGGSNSDVLRSIDNVLKNLISENNQYFRKVDFGSTQGEAQCIQDLSASDCQDCLSEASGRLRSECEASTWGNMYLGKCYIKYTTDNGNNKNNCNNCCNQKDGEAGFKYTLLTQSIVTVINLVASYFISKSHTKKVKEKVDKVEQISDAAKTIAETVENMVDQLPPPAAMMPYPHPRHNQCPYCGRYFHY